MVDRPVRRQETRAVQIQSGVEIELLICWNDAVSLTSVYPRKDVILLLQLTFILIIYFN